MKKQMTRRKAVLRRVTALLALALLLSQATVFGAVPAPGEAARENGAATEGNEVKEKTKPYNPFQLKEEVGEVQENTRSNVKHFDWTVRNDIFKRTYFFDAVSGGSIIVSAVIEPSDKIVQIGIVTPSGINRYVDSRELMWHKFELDETGEYCVFVENHCGSTVTVGGSYLVSP